LLVVRELDDAPGLTALAGEMLVDARIGKNGRPRAGRTGAAAIWGIPDSLTLIKYIKT
jgi:hypothetical protein